MAMLGFEAGFEARRAVFGIDEAAQRSIKALWPVIAQYVEGAVDGLLGGSKQLPQLAQIVIRNWEAIRKLEISHFTCLLGGELGDQYIESCRRTVEEEAALGLDARTRCGSGYFVLRAVIRGLTRKNRLSPARLGPRRLARFTAHCL